MDQATTQPVNIGDPKDLRLEKTLEDIPYFITEKMGAAMWAKQREIAEAVRDYDEVAVRSCHAAGKSYIAARILLAFIGASPWSVGWTTAPTSRQVYNILWREIRSAHKASKTPLGGEMLKTRWEINEDWFAYGFATDTGEQFQGIHAKSAKVLGVVDEASGVEDPIFEAAESTLTSQFAKLLMLGNCNKKTGYFANAFKRPGVKTIKISAYDTPNFIANGIRNAKDLKIFAEEKGIENAIVASPYLITPKFAWKIYQKYGPESNNYRIRIEAEFPLTDDNTLIDLDLIEKAMAREVTPDPTEIFVISCDPARYGSDRTAILERQGFKVWTKTTVTKFATTEVSGKLLVMRRAAKIAYPLASRHVIKIDTIGLGAGVYDEVMEVAKAEGWARDVIAVNAAESAVETEEYANLRTEMWFLLRDWLQEGDIPDDEDFREAADVRYTYTSKGKQQLEAKDDIKKRIGKSPDVMDALAISLSEKAKLKEPRIRVPRVRQ